jgi:hypothetical protein
VVDLIQIIKGLLLLSGCIFLILSVITIVGIVLIQINGGVV